MSSGHAILRLVFCDEEMETLTHRARVQIRTEHWPHVVHPTTGLLLDLAPDRVAGVALSSKPAGVSVRRLSHPLTLAGNRNWRTRTTLLCAREYSKIVAPSPRS